MEHFSRSGRPAGSPHNSTGFTRPLSRSRSLDGRTSHPTTGPSHNSIDFTRSLSRPQALDRSASHATESSHSPLDLTRNTYEAPRLPGRSTAHEARSARNSTDLPTLSGPQVLDRSTSHVAESSHSPLDFTRNAYEAPRLSGEHPSHPTVSPSSQRLGDTIIPMHQRDLSSRHNGDRISVRSRPEDHPRDHTVSHESSLSNEALHTYTQRVIKDLKIPPELRDQAEEQIKGMYKILEKSEKATSEQEYDEACQNVLRLAPDLRVLRWMREGEFGKVSGALFFGGKKTRLETNNLRTRGDLRLARESPDKRYLSRLSDRVTHEVAWRLNEPVHRASLAALLGGASTLTPLAYGGKFEPMAIPINIGATYLDTAIFKKFNYPWNLLITTGVWQASSFATAYSQLGVDKLTELVKNLRG